MKRLPLVLLLLVTGLMSCGPRTESELFEAAVGAQRTQKYDDAVELFERLLEEFPQSEKSPDAYYALGVLYQDRTKDFSKAIESYKKLYEAYPDHPTAPNALFMIGFLQHNEMKDTAAAKATYESFIERYPDSPLVSSARFELENLRKDPAEMFSTLEK